MAERTCCPHCGGDNGYEYRMPMVHIMSGPWGEEAEATSSDRDRSITIPVCVDCGKRVRDPITKGTNLT